MTTVVSIHREDERVYRGEFSDGGIAVEQAKQRTQPGDVVFLMTRFPAGDRHQQCYRVTPSGSLRFEHESYRGRLR